MLDLWDSGLKIAGGKWTMSGQDDHLSGWNFHFQSFWPDLSINRELKQWQRRRQKSNMRRLEKQQLCTWITLFSTFLGRRCTTMTWTFLISCFVEDGNTTQQLSFSFPELSYNSFEFTPEKFANIWRIVQDGISTIKFEAAQIHFLSSPMLLLKLPKNRPEKNTFLHYYVSGGQASSFLLYVSAC